MDRIKIEDNLTENIKTSNLKRLTPGKKSDLPNSEKTTENYNSKENTFFIYSSTMDTSHIWKSNNDTFKLVSQNKIEKNDNGHLLNLQTNSKEYLASCDSKYNSRDILLKAEQKIKFSHNPKETGECEELNNESRDAYIKDSDISQVISDWTFAGQGKPNVLFNKNQNLSIGQNESVWNNYKSSQLQNFWTNKVHKNYPTGLPVQETNTIYLQSSSQSDQSNNIELDDITKRFTLSSSASKQMSELKGLSNLAQDQSFFTCQLNSNSEILLYRHFKDMILQTMNQFKDEQRKVQDCDLIQKRFPESQYRTLSQEVQKKRQISQQRMAELQQYYEWLCQKMIDIEENILNSQRSSGFLVPFGVADKQFQKPEMKKSGSKNYALQIDKVGSMRMQPSKDFRLDVPEFIPGKKWHGLTQVDKENRNPILENTIGARNYKDSIDSDHQSNSWLFIQNLPSHVTVELIQKFFIQNNNPLVMPIHNNPFSRWMLLRFPNPALSQKAMHLISGKIGQVNLVNDQEANMKLQELKNAMDKFMDHQN